MLAISLVVSGYAIITATPQPFRRINETTQGDRQTGSGKRLLGRWTVVKVTFGGKDIEDAELSNSTMVFEDGELVTETKRGHKERFTLEVDATSDPPALRVVPKEALQKQSGWMIYSLEGDRLRLAFFDNLGARPDSFEPRKDLVVLELSKAHGKQDDSSGAVPRKKP